ncbi:MAG TPA: hypothetical protein PKJ63_04920 [Cyclobacteriaceae bacterium]|nr:hypothetical protein [Cyclobacteriaceae bacterium]
MSQSPDPLTHIRQLLENKSAAKQLTYKNLLNAFQILAEESNRVVENLRGQVTFREEDVTVDFIEVNEHEFQVKLAGDLLIFVLHTNIVTFDETHPTMQQPYCKENEINRYFGQIMIYNFMADSIRFNRVNDPGYLVARILINHENRFLVEGEGRLGFLYNQISTKPIEAIDLNNIVQNALTIAIENDLMAPPFPQVRFITLHQKMEKTSELGAGQKIGFRMNYENKIN